MLFLFFFCLDELAYPSWAFRQSKANGKMIVIVKSCFLLQVQGPEKQQKCHVTIETLFHIAEIYIFTIVCGKKESIRIHKHAFLIYAHWYSVLQPLGETRPDQSIENTKVNREKIICLLGNFVLVLNEIQKIGF